MQTVEEIRIPVPWGHVAGKWWGPKNVRPILCLHGIQDNAGTFDTLIPLLPRRFSYLALDLPGHGLSSYLPAGQIYSMYGNMYTFHLLLEQFKWDKVSLLCHSMSAVVCFHYFPNFQEKIDFLIALDAFQPLILSTDNVLLEWKVNLIKGLEADVRNQSTDEPPSCTYDELVRKYVEATDVPEKAASLIVKRGSKESKLHPNQYYFSRDNRTKSIYYSKMSLEMISDITQKFRFPLCLIRAKITRFPDQILFVDQLIEVMRKTNPLFEVHFIEGNHHIHLSEPEKINEVLCKFIDKYRPVIDEVKYKL